MGQSVGHEYWHFQRYQTLFILLFITVVVFSFRPNGYHSLNLFYCNHILCNIIILNFDPYHKHHISSMTPKYSEKMTDLQQSKITFPITPHNNTQMVTEFENPRCLCQTLEKGICWKTVVYQDNAITEIESFPWIQYVSDFLLLFYVMT